MDRVFRDSEKYAVKFSTEPRSELLEDTLHSKSGQLFWFQKVIVFLNQKKAI